MATSAMKRSALTIPALTAAGLPLGATPWTAVAEELAKSDQQAARSSQAQSATARSVIVLWLQGGPSQLETFDPHPGTNSAAGSQAIATGISGVQIDQHYPLLAERLQHVSLVRSVVSKEGDHERATYYLKTGYRPDPTLIHPSLGAILCYQLTDEVEIPRHISILPNTWAARGGYLGDQYDAFKVGQVGSSIADVKPRVSEERFRKRLEALQRIVEPSFAQGRPPTLDADRTLHLASIERARRMMTSEQLQAFEIQRETEAVRRSFGDSEFGRGCLAAARLIDVGVRCVEVTLSGWDTHAANHEGQRTQAKILDPAFAALLDYLRQRDKLKNTIIVCCGEFGRTPRVNPLGGRDHWPHGFTIALAGGGLAAGQVIGETSPDAATSDRPPAELVADPHSVADVYATVLRALGIDFSKEHTTPIKRPMSFSDGRVIAKLLSIPS
ncbi:MAG: DUF1501 domain-containing protein [Planctomycetota bacterium]